MHESKQTTKIRHYYTHLGNVANTQGNTDRDDLTVCECDSPESFTVVYYVWQQMLDTSI